MSGNGNLRGYEFWKAECPYCERVIAISIDAEGFSRFRPHNMKKGVRCRQGSHRMGREEAERRMAAAKKSSK